MLGIRNRSSRLAGSEKVGLLNKPQRDWQLMLLVVCVGGTSLNVLLTVFNGIIVNKLAGKETPVLVERLNGEPVRVGPIEHNQRSAETIRRFTANTLTMLLNWSGYLPPEDLSQLNKPRLDPSYTFEGTNTRITTAAWQASEALAADFRPAFMKRLAELTPLDVFSGNTQTVLTILRISDPQQLEPGRWRVDVVSSLGVYRKNATGKTISFNKTVFLRAVDPPPLPGATALEKQIYAVRQSGLEIYAIRDLERGNL